ncbi:MAG: hypothetical protein ACE5LC_00495 [Candidatus Aminicenantales bacterium]
MNKIKKKASQPLWGMTLWSPSPGFTSLESIISLALSLLLILSCLEFLFFARQAFFKLKSTEERTQAALLAIERIKKDVQQGGLGIQLPLSLGLLSGITKEGKGVVITSLDKTYSLLSDLLPGETSLRLETTKGLKKKTEICLSDGIKAELKLINDINSNSIILSSPSENYYPRESAMLLSLRKVFLFFDEKNQKIRRKVNLSSAQPLLEEVLNASLSYEEKKNLLTIFFSLKGSKEKTHEFHFFAKNIALSITRK